MKVAVVGLGIAGLRTAMLLEEAGHEVLAFEARDRVGGRLYTITNDEGMVYEAGGEWIDADHERILTLLSEFGLSALKTPEVARRVFFKDTEATDLEPWDDAAADMDRVEEAAMELAKSLTIPVWTNDRPDLDAKTVADFVAEHTMSERGRWWVTARLRSDEGDDLDRIGLLGWLGFYRQYLDRDGSEMSAFRVPIGFGTLCHRMADSLTAKLQLGQVLKNIRVESDKVVLGFADQTVEVDAAVVTLPPTVLRHIEIAPGLPPERANAIASATMSRANKVNFEFSRAWWRDEGWSGAVHTDGPLQQLWDGSLGTVPVMNAYVCGNDSENLTEESARAALLAQFPQAEEHLVKVTVRPWATEEFSRGGFSHIPPRFVLTGLRHLSAPVGRLHFAGEYTSDWTGFIEGALESAERVAEEIKVHA